MLRIHKTYIIPRRTTAHLKIWLGRKGFENKLQGMMV
jgi:hypothetical protein